MFRFYTLKNKTAPIRSDLFFAVKSSKGNKLILELYFKGLGLDTMANTSNPSYMGTRR
jgi:hypothetical protein